MLDLENQITVLLIELSETEKLPIDFCASAFPNRFVRAQRFRQKEDYLRSLGVGALFSACGISEDSIARLPSGKPIGIGLPFCFNATHSGDYSALALAKSEVGIDLERYDEKHLSLASKVCTAEELKWIEKDLLARFFSVWTMKEALAKYTGEGLSSSFSGRNVLPLINGLSQTENGKNVFGASVGMESYALSVVSEGERLPVVVKCFTADEVLQAAKKTGQAK